MNVLLQSRRFSGRLRCDFLLPRGCAWLSEARTLCLDDLRELVLLLQKLDICYIRPSIVTWTIRWFRARSADVILSMPYDCCWNCAWGYHPLRYCTSHTVCVNSLCLHEKHSVPWSLHQHSFLLFRECSLDRVNAGATSNVLDYKLEICCFCV